jgi:hypothetical protein
VAQLWNYLRGRLKNLERAQTVSQPQAVAAAGGAVYQSA